MSRITEEQLRLYLVTDRSFLSGRSLEDVVTKAVRGGVTMVQLREKEASTRDFIDIALSIKKILSPLNVPLIINDRIDVALASDADGVHIGQSDMPFALARKLLGPEKIIGLSVENMQQALDANRLDVDYIGISPVFQTNTKRDTAPALGLEGVKAITSASLHPSVGIGGMNIDTAAETVAAGADGVAVVSAIMGVANPEAASRSILEEVDTGLHKRGTVFRLPDQNAGAKPS